MAVVSGVVAGLHEVVQGDGEPDQALSFTEDSFPLEGVAGYRKVSRQPLVLQSDLAAAIAERDRLHTERDEARGLVIEANNSLFGSQGYFHSSDGGAYDRYHLARAIEDLKARSRKDRKSTRLNSSPS